jgi:hypothetical protein
MWWIKIVPDLAPINRPISDVVSRISGARHEVEMSQETAGWSNANNSNDNCGGRCHVF